MYFPVAEIEVEPWLPPLVAFSVAFFTSMSGVSGAFLLLPFQVSILGFQSPAVSATNHLFNIIAIPGAVYQYLREGRIIWPVAWLVVLGTLPGVYVGALIRIHYLQDIAHFKLFIALVLLYVSFRLLQDIIRPTVQLDKVEEAFYLNYSPSGEQFNNNVIIKSLNIAGLKFSFKHCDYYMNVPAVIIMSLLVGLIGGIYGIGGGALIAPLLMSFFGLPVYIVAGAALLATFVTSLTAILSYQLITPAFAGQLVQPDWGLGILFGLGGFAGMYLGARWQKYFPARVIKIILMLFTVMIAIYYLFSL